MQTVKIKEFSFVKYIDKVDVLNAIEKLAKQISADYKDSAEPPVLLVTLCGAMPFATYLAQSMDIDTSWAFVRCSSYGASMTSGNFTMPVEPTVSVEGRDVIVAEDIVDSGKTWMYLYNYCMEKGAKSVKIAALTTKKDVYKGSLPIDYVAIELEDKFIVGFGLDYDQCGRYLSHIYQLDESKEQSI